MIVCVLSDLTCLPLLGGGRKSWYIMLSAQHCSVIYLYKNDTMLDIGMCQARVCACTNYRRLTLECVRLGCVRAPTTDISILVSFVPQAV